MHQPAHVFRFGTIAAVLFTAAIAHADGPGAYRPRDRAPAPATGPAAIPEQGAVDLFNAGYALIQRADHAEGLAAAATNDSERKTARNEAQEAYRSSLQKFTAATKLDPSMHEAHTYLGYANRKLGRYEAALQAYDRALQINPDYPQAIEYQGEAYLGLNRLEEARFNYLRLYALDKQQAAKLLQAMQAWLAANQAKPPAGVDVDSFAAWVQERAGSLAHESKKTSSW